MAYVITEKCLGERYASCAKVCPVECIHPGDHKGEAFMIIDPEVCIDCGLCLPECPIDAIVDAVDKDPSGAKLNADLSHSFGSNPAVPERPVTDPPKKAHNKLRGA